MIEDIRDRNAAHSNVISNCYFDAKTNIYDFVTENAIITIGDTTIRECILTEFVKAVNGYSLSLYNNVFFKNKTALHIIINANSTINQSIFHKNVIDIECDMKISESSNDANLRNGTSINYESASDILDTNPLFVNENEYDFHIQTIERALPSEVQLSLKPASCYYAVDSVCKAPYNPPVTGIPHTYTPPYRDIGAYFELRAIQLTEWEEAEIIQPKSFEIENIPIDSESAYSYDGSYLANFKKLLRHFVFTFGNDWQVNYKNIHDIVEMLRDKGLKKFYPNGEGEYLALPDISYDSETKTYTFSEQNISENELVGKWIGNRAAGLYNIIVSNTKSSITINNSNLMTLPSDVSGISGYKVFNGIFCYQGYLDWHGDTLHIGFGGVNLDLRKMFLQVFG